MFKYLRDDIEDKYGLLELQESILEIALYLDNLCKNNDIDYCLMGGSALGAKRHKGFIPWDDDLDIFMTIDNYEKFRRVFFEEGDKEVFYLQECGYYRGMVTSPKLRKNNTTYIEEDSKQLDIHQGIFVDIFILHNCPESTLKRFWQYFWAKLVITKGLALRQYKHKDRRKQVLIEVAKFLPTKSLVSYGLKQVYRYDNYETQYYCDFFGKANLKDGIYKKILITPSKYNVFEKVQLKVPNDIHLYLTERFGDYMVLPSDKEIMKNKHAEYWNVNKSFKKYVNTTENYIDEYKLL